MPKKVDFTGYLFKILRGGKDKRHGSYVDIRLFMDRTDDFIMNQGKLNRKENKEA
jgi:hypothetical protein